jgi:hypothetical protein
MRKLFTFIFALTLIGSVANAQVAPDPAAPPVAQPDGSKIKFTESEFAFPDGPVGTPVTHEFVFINEGTAPLTIENARASCGCTTPKWTTDAIPPGGKGFLSATYNMGHAGSFNKSITVTTKGAETVVLYIKGNAVDPNPALPITVSEAGQGEKIAVQPVVDPKPVVAPAPPVVAPVKQAPAVVVAPPVVQEPVVNIEKPMTRREIKKAKKEAKSLGAK